MRYRKKPVVVEAEIFSPKPDEDYCEGVVGFSDPDDRLYPCDICGEPWVHHGQVKTLEGNLLACPGDWIITGVKGKKYPCKPDVFEMTYELIEGENDEE